jgi:hypothetical protein
MSNKQELQKMIQIEVSRQLSSINERLRVLEGTSRELVSSSPSQELVNAVSNQLSRQMTQQVSKHVYNNVVTKFNKEVMPKVDNMVQLVKYNMEDGGEVVTNYRRNLDKVCNTNTKMITSGGNSQYISEHVRLFFNDDE